MTQVNGPACEIWLAAGVRTPFAKVDGALGRLDAIELSVPVVRHMIDQLDGAMPEFAVWGAVIPNLAWSNIAREVLMEAGVRRRSRRSPRSWRARRAWSARSRPPG